jgi:alpha-1,3-glucosyltransferase
VTAAGVLCTWQVARRIFPVKRGLYEDYLSNFWCTTSVAVKWKQLLSNQVLMPLCASITILAALPSMVQQILHPCVPGLLLGMANSAFAFFMFSYQVGDGCVAAATHGFHKTVQKQIAEKVKHLHYSGCCL